MAQPAVPVNEDKTDLLGIPPFWAKPSVNLPFLREPWIGQFFLAVGLKDNINPQDLLVEPAEVIDDPPPKPEVVSPEEDAGYANARVLRDQAAVRRITELNVERRRKGPRISQNWFYHKAEARLKSRLFFALGNEEKIRFADYLDVRVMRAESCSGILFFLNLFFFLYLFFDPFKDDSELFGKCFLKCSFASV